MENQQTLSAINIQAAREYFRENPPFSLSAHAADRHTELHIHFFAELVRIAGLYSVARVGLTGDVGPLVERNYIDTARNKALALQARHHTPNPQADEDAEKLRRRWMLLDFRLGETEGNLGFNNTMKSLPDNVLSSTVEMLYMVYANILVSPNTTLRIVPYLTRGTVCAVISNHGERLVDAVGDRLWNYSHYCIKDATIMVPQEKLNLWIREAIFYAMEFPEKDGAPKFLPAIMNLIAKVVRHETERMVFTDERDIVQPFFDAWLKLPTFEKKTQSQDEMILAWLESIQRNNAQIAALQEENATFIKDMKAIMAKKVPF